MSTLAFLALLLAVAASRLIEIAVSKRNQARLRVLGATDVRDPRFGFMVAVHVAILCGSAVEVMTLHRPFIPALGTAMLCVFAGAETLRWWVIRTLGRHWNVQVMNSVRLGIVCSGPFGIVRHPNYVAVFIEMTALPLIHSAWMTALVGAAAHLWVLSGRVKLEESVLLADPAYRAAMTSTPRFVPRLR